MTSAWASLQVREKDLAVVIRTLEEEFSIYREVGGESVPVLSQDTHNGLRRNDREGTHPSCMVPRVPGGGGSEDEASFRLGMR